MDVINGITDDLLHLILLRIDSPIYLLRAASTCKRLYRIVAGRGFLDRFRSIHGPPVSYAYYNGNEEFSRPDFDSSYLCLDFLPGISSTSSVRWEPRDRRAGLVLLERLHHSSGITLYQDWVVCEPLSRRYEIIPRLSTSTADAYRHTLAFLLDGKDGIIDILNFKVLCAVHFLQGYRPYLFTSGGSWREIRIGSQSPPTYLRLMGFAESSVYWHAHDKTLLAVNRRTTKLACFLFPHVRDSEYSAIRFKATVTSGRDGKARIVVCSDDYRGTSTTMEVFARQRGSSEWVLEKRIHLSAQAHGLPPYYYCCFYRPMTAVSVHRAGTVIIRLAPDVIRAGEWRVDLDRETVEPLDRVTKIQYPIEIPWPPVLHD